MIEALLRRRDGTFATSLEEARGLLTALWAECPDWEAAPAPYDTRTSSASPVTERRRADGSALRRPSRRPGGSFVADVTCVPFTSSCRSVCTSKVYATEPRTRPGGNLHRATAGAATPRRGPSVMRG